jgi:hypothetical protein
MRINRSFVTGFLLAFLLMSIIFLAVLIPQRQDKSPSAATSPTPQLQDKSPSATLAATGLSIKGNRFVTGSGEPINLHGVNYAGFVWNCSHNQELSFPQDTAAVQALESWHIYMVRIGIAEDCWLGINGLSAQWSGLTYQQAVVNFANLLHQNGIYVELALMYVAPGNMVSIRQLPMPDTDYSTTVWTQIATTFKNDHNVIFGAYGEPHPNSWSCWRDGGSSCGDLGYTAVGMQQIVNTIRATGATQPITVSGISWGIDLSQVDFIQSLDKNGKAG